MNVVAEKENSCYDEVVSSVKDGVENAGCGWGSVAVNVRDGDVVVCNVVVAGSEEASFRS